MARWEFESGHTAAEFNARHMMVALVRGLFKDVHGEVQLDFDKPTASSFEAEIDATKLWTGEPERDAHLRSADFFDVEHHPRITFRSTGVEQVGLVLSRVTGDLTIRGVTRPVTLAPDRVLGRHPDQPPRLQCELERPARQGRSGGRRRGLRCYRCRGYLEEDLAEA